MVSLADLWLPILVAAVLVHVASFVAWMVLPHHRSDFRRLPDEDALRAELRRQNVAPAEYAFPHSSGPQEMKDPAWRKKCEEGPNGTLIVRPAGTNMGKSLVLHLVHCLTVSLLVAYVAGRTLPPGTDYLAVFQVAGTAAILGWAGPLAVNSNWMGRPWSTTLKDILDGIVYGLLTAGVFGWLWP